MHFPEGMSTESLYRIRPLPNGRIDFLSVDELARLQANMTAQFDGKEFTDAESSDVAKDKSSAPHK
jgi:hypothetical protein